MTLYQRPDGIVRGRTSGGIDMMDEFLSVAAIIFASSGFWAFMQFLLSKKHFKSDDVAEVKSDVKALSKVVKGLSRYRIIEVCNGYADRGYITDDEYSDIYNGLWLPYHDGLHGNGAAQRAMERVKRLPRRDEEDEDES